MVVPAKLFNRLDLPTLDRPTTATSPKSSGGNEAGVLAPAKNDSNGNYIHSTLI